MPMAAPHPYPAPGARRTWPLLLLAAAACAACIVQTQRLDTLPPSRDEADCLRLGLRWRAAFDRPLRERPRLVAALVSSESAPLLHAAAAPCLSRVGRTRAAAVLANIPFLALLLVSVYCIGSILHGEGTGAGAAALAVSYPLALGLSRQYLPGTADAALAAAAVCAALCAERSRTIPWHLLLGLAFGMGTLSSPLFPLFAAPPIAWILFGPRRTLRYRGTPSRRALLRLLALAVAAATAAPCIPRLAAAWGGLFQGVSPRGFFRFPRLLVDSVFFLPMALLLLAGISSAAVRRRADPALLLWLFVPLLVLSLSGAGDPRLFAPALPAAALLTAAGIAMLQRPAWRRGLAAAALLAAALNAAAFTFPSAAALLDLSIPLRPGGAGLPVVRGVIPAAGIGVPLREEWRIDEILRDLSAQAGPGGTSLGWFLAPHPRFHGAALIYRLEAGRYRISAAAPGDAAFIITRLVGAGQQEELRRFTAPWLHLDTIKSYPLPDGSEAALHRAILTRRRRYDAAGLPGETGEIRAPDAGAGPGRARGANRDSSPPGVLAATPAHPLDPGAYRLTVLMRCRGARPGAPLARIELSGANGGILAEREIALPEGGDSGGYRSVDLDFALPRREALAARVVHTGAADLEIDTISIAPRLPRGAGRAPTPFPAAPPRGGGAAD